MEKSELIMLIGALVVPCASGLAILAIKYPETYEKLSSRLYWATMFAFFAASAWIAGIKVFSSELIELLPENTEVIRNLADSMTPNHLWIFGATLLITLYVGGLSILGTHIKAEERRRNHRNF